MARFEIGRPSHEVRLQDWPAGRSNEFRLMINRLEEGLNDSLAAQVLQSGKRAVNNEIPFVLNSTVNATGGYRQIELSFDAPPGLGGAGRGATPHPDRQLLFYEIQHDSTAAFASPVTIETPQTHLLIGGIGLGETRFFRIRVVNTKFQVSPWTSTVVGTAAQGKITVRTLPSVTDRIAAPIGEWQNMITHSVSALRFGAICVTAHIAIGTPQTDYTAGTKTYRAGPAFVQVRILRKVNDGSFQEIGDRFRFAARPGYTGVKDGNAPMAFGTIITPFLQEAPDDDATITFTIQAMLLRNSQWRGGDGSGNKVKSDPMFYLRNGRILEVLTVL